MVLLSRCSFIATVAERSKCCYLESLKADNKRELHFGNHLATTRREFRVFYEVAYVVTASNVGIASSAAKSMGLAVVSRRSDRETATIPIRIGGRSHN